VKKAAAFLKAFIIYDDEKTAFTKLKINTLNVKIEKLRSYLFINRSDIQSVIWLHGADSFLRI
jgi:hypothetical protein